MKLIRLIALCAISAASIAEASSVVLEIALTTPGRKTRIIHCLTDQVTRAGTDDESSTTVLPQASAVARGRSAFHGAMPRATRPSTVRLSSRSVDSKTAHDAQSVRFRQECKAFTADATSVYSSPILGFRGRDQRFACDRIATLKCPAVRTAAMPHVNSLSIGLSS